MKANASRRFHDRLTHPLHKPRHWLRMMLQAPRNSRSVGREQARLVPRSFGSAAHRPRAEPAAGEARITWVGHATFLLEMDGLALLTDPVWSRRLVGGIRRATPPGLAWEELPPIDAVLVSHNHYDHLDARTLRRLPRATAIFAPLGLGRWFRRRGFANVHELDWWQSRALGTLRIEFVPAHHWSRRGLWDTNASLWGGWVVAPRRGAAVYFAGDTGYGDGALFCDIARRHPDIAAALLPVGAYAPRWYLRHVHMDPEEAVRAFSGLGARAMVPMHWGAFRLAHEPILEPLGRTYLAWEAAGLPQDDLWDLALGEGRSIPTPNLLIRPTSAPQAPTRRERKGIGSKVCA